MKKLQANILISLCLIFLTTEVIAQNIPLACQGESAAGLDWENGRWVTKKFNTHKFILVKAENSLTAESVAKALENPYANQVTCRNTLNTSPRTYCTDLSGEFLYFDPKTLKGSIAILLGGSLQASERDSVTVEVFSCTPF